MLTLQRQLFLMHSFTGAAPVGAVLYCCAVLCCAALRCAALRCAALRCAALRFAALRCTVLCCAVHWHRAALFMALLQCFDRARSNADALKHIE